MWAVIHLRLLVATPIMPTKVDHLLRPQAHVWIQLNQEEQMVKLVIPATSARTLMAPLGELLTTGIVEKTAH